LDVAETGLAVNGFHLISAKGLCTLHRFGEFSTFASPQGSPAKMPLAAPEASRWLNKAMSSKMKTHRRIERFEVSNTEPPFSRSRVGENIGKYAIAVAHL
jgi:hypothetical protein